MVVIFGVSNVLWMVFAVCKFFSLICSKCSHSISALILALVSCAMVVKKGTRIFKEWENNLM